MPFVIAASKEYLQRCGVPQSPEELPQHDCIMVGNGQSWHLTAPNANIEIPARVVLRFGSSMSIAVAHAVCAGIGLAPLPRLVFEDPMFKDVLRPVLVKHPLRHPYLYAIYVSRKHLPLKVRTFVDHLIERTRIPLPWEDVVTVEQERAINGAPVVRLARDE
jgi:DNA-binding transcriptional LysR family regulator